jgi:hypothetical protein
MFLPTHHTDAILLDAVAKDTSSWHKPFIAEYGCILDVVDKFWKRLYAICLASEKTDKKKA